MLTLEDVQTWLEGKGVTEAIARNVQPLNPRKVITITDTGGFGLEVEEAYDNPTIQIRCRAPLSDAAYDLAFEMDALLLNQSRPFSIGSTRVLSVSRLGGRPSFLAEDERGITYTSNYILKSTR